MLSTELSAAVERALGTARRHHDGRWPGLLWPRAVIIRRRWLPARTPNFGAFVWLNILFVDERLEQAPTPILSAIVAHEYGHVARGHACTGLAIVLAVLVLMGLPPAKEATSMLILTASLLYLGIAVGLVWLRRPTREVEADAYGAGVVGRSAAIDALGWVASWTGQGWTPSLLGRRAKLLDNHI